MNKQTKGVPSRFRGWASGQVLEDFRAGTTLWGWTAAVVWYVVSILIAVQLGWLKFPWWSVPVTAMAATLDSLAVRLDRRSGDPVDVLILSLLASTLVQTCCGLLMVRASPLGAAVFGGALLLAAAYHGYCYRATPSQPYIVIGTVAALILTAALSPTEQHLAIAGLVGVTSIFGAFLMGMFGFDRDCKRAEIERLQAVLAEKMLKAHSARADQLAAILEQVSMGYYELRNTLVAAADNLKWQSQGRAWDSEKNCEQAPETRRSVEKETLN